MILLSRLTDTGLVIPHPNGGAPHIPPTTPNDHFWYFELITESELMFNYVYLHYSYSSRRIPLPYGDPARFLVIATPYLNMNPDNPYHTPTELGNPRLTPLPPRPAISGFVDVTHYSYYNVNWFVANNFFYSFAEDSDGNGRIDRIRAQCL
jgi:hypothetical protein